MPFMDQYQEYEHTRQLQIEVLGNPDKEVIENIRLAVVETLNEMNYRGDMPKVAVSDGYVTSSRGEPWIACYDWESKPRTIRIGQRGLRSYWAQINTEVEDKITALICASHETTHFVQDQQGRLPKKGNKDTIDKPEIHYADEHEREAEVISFKVTNKILGYKFIEKLH